MAKRKVFTGLLVAGGSIAGSLLYRRRAVGRRERVDLFAEDGSMVSLGDGAPQSVELLTLARELIALTAP